MLVVDNLLQTSTASSSISQAPYLALDTMKCRSVESTDRNASREVRTSSGTVTKGAGMICRGGGAKAGLEHFRRRFCILVNARQ